MDKETLITVGQNILSVAAFACGLGYFYWAWRMIYYGRKEGIKAFGREVLWNPFNICFRPDLLTASGLRARRWFFVCFSGFPICILAIFGLSLIR